jgi:hypothetical protein
LARLPQEYIRRARTNYTVAWLNEFGHFFPKKQLALHNHN